MWVVLSFLTAILIALILFVRYHIIRIVISAFFSKNDRESSRKADVIQRRQREIYKLSPVECELQIESLVQSNKLAVKPAAGSEEQQARLAKLHPELRAFFQKYPSIAVPGGLAVGIDRFNLSDPKLPMTRRNGIPPKLLLLQLGEDDDFAIFADAAGQSPALYEYDKDEFFLEPGCDTPCRMLLLDYDCIEIEKEEALP